MNLNCEQPKKRACRAKWVQYSEGPGWEEAYFSEFGAGATPKCHDLPSGDPRCSTRSYGGREWAGWGEGPDGARRGCHNLSRPDLACLYRVQRGHGKVILHLEAATNRAWSPHIFFRTRVLVSTLWRGRHFCRFSPVTAWSSGIERRPERTPMQSIGILLAGISAIAMLAARKVRQARMAPARQSGKRKAE